MLLHCLWLPLWFSAVCSHLSVPLCAFSLWLLLYPLCLWFSFFCFLSWPCLQQHSDELSTSGFWFQQWQRLLSSTLRSQSLAVRVAGNNCSMDLAAPIVGMWAPRYFTVLRSVSCWILAIWLYLSGTSRNRNRNT